MGDKELLIWPIEYLDWVAPKKKTKRELKKEAREEFNKKLLERVVLPEEEIKMYNFPLNKKDLREYFDKNEWEIGKDYFMNPGVPQMLLTTLSKYSNKEQEALFVLDMVRMYNSLKNIFPDQIKYNELKKFSKANKLFFGSSQYGVMEKYLSSLD